MLSMFDTGIHKEEPLIDINSNKFTFRSFTQRFAVLNAHGYISNFSHTCMLLHIIWVVGRCTTNAEYVDVYVYILFTYYSSVIISAFQGTVFSIARVYFLLIFRNLMDKNKLTKIMRGLHWTTTASERVLLSIIGIVTCGAAAKYLYGIVRDSLKQ